MISDNEMVQIKRQSGRRENSDRTEEPMRLRRDSQPEPENEDEEEYEEQEESDEFDYDPKMERVTTILAVVAGLIICGIIIFLLVKVFGVFGGKSGDDKTPSSPIITSEESFSASSTEQKKEQVEMPAVTGWNVEDAKAALVRVGLEAEVEYKESDEYDEGIVFSTGVDAGAKVEKGSKVKLVVSSGSQGIEVPDTTGKTYEDAERNLTDKGFLVNKAESYSETIASGLIITQNPVGGTKAPKGSVVTVTVSLGAEANKIRVPNVMGLSEDDGTFELIEAGLTLTNVSQVYNSEIPEGHICYQSWTHGSYVDPGTGIEIRVSLGPEPKPVTYKYNGSIEAPTAAEAPDYVAGDDVTVVLVTDSGKELLNTTTSSFPISANSYGLDSSAGTIKFSYVVKTQGSTVTDPETGAVTVVPGTSETKTFERRVTFTQE